MGRFPIMVRCACNSGVVPLSLATAPASEEATLSSARSDGATHTGLPALIWVATALWVVIGGAMTLVPLRGSTGTAMVLLTVAAVVAFGSLLVGALLWSQSDRAGWLAGGLLLSALAAPTTFAYPLDLLPALTALAIIIWASRTALRQTQPRRPSVLWASRAPESTSVLVADEPSAGRHSVGQTTAQGMPP